MVPFCNLKESVYFNYFYIPRALYHQRRTIKEIRNRGYARISFIVSSLSMWRCQKLVDLMNKDNHFRIQMALYPFWTNGESKGKEQVKQLKDFFDKLSVDYVDLSGENFPGRQLRTYFNPDIVFYPQPYNYLYGNDLDSTFFYDKLLCYIPYGMLIDAGDWWYKNYLDNVAWKLFFTNNESANDASKVLYNKGKNIRVIGDPISDSFFYPADSDPWKRQDQEKKRVIWAPHHSLVDEGLLHRNSFLYLANEMLEIAKTYKDKIQFAFKPHPKLLSTLYNIPGWGKDKADAYYYRWANGDNTQLETGEYVNLFKCSDALIHDCDSFIVEYHLTGGPVMFISNDINDVAKRLNNYGTMALHAHYQGSRKEDITHFIDSVVLNGEDPMRSERERFRKKYLTPPSGQSVAYNIYRDLVSSLGFEK